MWDIAVLFEKAKLQTEILQHQHARIGFAWFKPWVKPNGQNEQTIFFWILSINSAFKSTIEVWSRKQNINPTHDLAWNRLIEKTLQAQDDFALTDLSILNYFLKENLKEKLFHLKSNIVEQSRQMIREVTSYSKHNATWAQKHEIKFSVLVFVQVSYGKYFQEWKAFSFWSFLRITECEKQYYSEDLYFFSDSLL